MAEFEVPAGASRVLLGALGTADILDLVVEGLERGVHLGIVLTQVSGGLIGSHVPERIGTFLRVTQACEGGHVDAGAGGTGKTWETGVSGRTLTNERGC